MKKLFLFSGTLMLSAACFAQFSVTTGGQKYTVIEDVTGAWCQFCPDGTVKQEQTLAAYPKAIGTALHNADKMTFADGNVVMASPNLVGGYPGGLVDRGRFPGMQSAGYPQTHVSRTYWNTAAAQQIATTPKWDVTVLHSFNNTTKTITITVTAKSLVAQTGNFTVNAWIIEDSVIGPDITGYNQVNAYHTQSGHPYFGAGNPIKGFVHRHVERAYLGGTWGSTGVITANPAANATFTKVYTYTIPAKYDSITTGAPATILKNFSIVGMVMKDTTSKSDRMIMNAVRAKLMTTPNAVTDVTALNDLSVFPNPAQDIITVKGILNTPADVTLNIVNTLGQVVLGHHYHYTGNMFGENVDISTPPNGMYFLDIITTNGGRTTERLVVSK